MAPYSVLTGLAPENFEILLPLRLSILVPSQVNHLSLPPNSYLLPTSKHTSNCQDGSVFRGNEGKSGPWPLQFVLADGYLCTGTHLQGY
jgi:hypothetical protein